MPDLVFTSVLKRAIRTQWLMLEELDLLWLPVERSWRLNERHYGALQGLNKAQTAAAPRRGAGEDLAPQLRHPAAAAEPRRSAPSALRSPLRRRSTPAELPATESLKDTLARVMPYWDAAHRARTQSGRKVLVVAHGNSLRALVKMLDGCPSRRSSSSTFRPAYRCCMNSTMRCRPRGSRYLGDPEAIQAAAEAVKRQTAGPSTDQGAAVAPKRAQLVLRPGSVIQPS